MYLKGLAKTLKQPHPRASERHVLRTAVVIGAVIAVFLIVFQPFGIYLIEHSALKMLVLGGYGLVTFAVVIFCGIVLPVIFPRLYNREKWTLGRDLLLSGALVFFMVGLCNMLYSIWVFRFSIGFRSFLFFQVATVCVGLLPYTVHMLLRHIHLLRQHTQEATVLNSELETYQEEPVTGVTGGATARLISIQSENGSERIEIHSAQFAYAESADNYVKIWYEANGKMKMKMMRLTLKRLEEYFEHEPSILRCHRTYMVNIHFVTTFSGNAQGLKLKISHMPDVLVPVSRSMVADIRALLNSPE